MYLNVPISSISPPITLAAAALRRITTRNHQGYHPHYHSHHQGHQHGYHHLIPSRHRPTTQSGLPIVLLKVFIMLTGLTMANADASDRPTTNAVVTSLPSLTSSSTRPNGGEGCDDVFDDNRLLIGSGIVTFSDEENPTCVSDEISRLERLVDKLPCYNTDVEYNRANEYTDRIRCSDCKMLYAHWIHGLNSTFFYDDQPIEVCQTIACKAVVRACPYIHPKEEGSYSSEPSFMCDNDVTSSVYSENATVHRCFYFNSSIAHSLKEYFHPSGNTTCTTGTNNTICVLSYALSAASRHTISSLYLYFVCVTSFFSLASHVS